MFKAWHGAHFSRLGVLKLAARPRAAAVEAAAAEVHAIPRKHVNNVVRFVRLVENGVKHAKNVALLSSLVGTVRQRRGKHMQQSSRLEPCRGTPTAHSLGRQD